MYKRQELEREEAAQKKPWQQPGEAAFCLIEEAVNLENEMIDEWIVFRWKRVYPADVFLKFPADDWEKELIETFAGYSHEEIDLERYRKKDRAKFFCETEEPADRTKNFRQGQKKL